MRRLNFKLLTVFVVVVGLLGGGAALLHRRQVRRTARALLTKAAAAESQGRLDQTRDELARYLALKPRDTDTLARYAALLDRLAATPQDRARAAATLERVLRRDPGRRESRLRLAVLMMGMERPIEARPHLQFLLQTAPDDGELEHLLGRCAEATGDFVKAADWHDRARRHAPARLDAFERLANLLRGRLDAPERADLVMNEMVAKNPRSTRARLDRARYRRQFGLAGADDDLAQAREIEPDSADVALATARVAQEKQDFDQARRILARCAAHHPRDARIDEALAALELRAGRPGAGIAVLRRALERQPGQRDLRWALAHLLAQTGDVADLKRHLGPLRESGFAERPLDYLDAYLSYNRGEWREAATRLEGLQPALEDWPELQVRSQELLGRCQGRLGDSDQEIAAFQRAAKLSPDWPPARLGLASALASRGRTGPAIEECRAALPRAPEAAEPLARLLIRRNATRPAADQEWDEVASLVNEMARVNPDAIEPTLLRADALAARGTLGAARDVLNKARDQHPRRVEPRLALARLAYRESGSEAALAVLEEARRALGDAVEIRLARIALTTPRDGASQSLRRELPGLDQVAKAEQPALLRGLAAAFVRVGDVKEAERLYRRWADLDPKDMNPRLALFELAAQANDDEGLSRIVPEIKRAEGGQGPLARYAEARVLIRKAGRGDRAARERARSILGDLAARRPSWPLVPLALAELDSQAGDRDGEIRDCLKALELGEQSPAVIERAARLLFAARRYDEAALVLQGLPDSVPSSIDLQRLTIGTALQTQHADRAVELARKAAADRPNDPRERLWLSQVLWAADRRGEAEAVLGQAVEQPDAPAEAWVALVQYRQRLGLTEKAEDATRRAESKLPKDQAPFALAQCHEALGHADQASRWYENALAALPDETRITRSFVSFLIQSGRAAEAETKLRAALSRTNQTPEEKAWARRTLAVVLTLATDYRRVREAQTLMEGHGETPDDLRAVARVLVAQRTRRRRREAIAVLARLDRGEQLEADDRLLFAQLLDLEGDWSKSQGQWQRLLKAQPRNPLYLAEYAETSRKRGQAGEARALADRLEQVEPSSLRAVTLRARLLKDQGQLDEALARVNAYAQRPRSQPAAVGALLEELGLLPAAEAQFRKAAASPGRPEDALALAEFLGRRGRTGEALDLCERAWATCPLRSSARACVSILEAAKASDDQVRRVAGWLEDACAKHPEETAATTALAVVRERQGRYPEAETLYRRAIERGDGGVPLNNLAWLVALKEGEGGEALRLADRAIDLMGPEPELLDTRAVALLATGRTERAVADLEEAVAARPAPSILFHLARAQLRAHNPKAASAAFRLATKSGLAASSLHPLEQTAFEQMRAELRGK